MAEARPPQQPSLSGVISSDENETAGFERKQQPADEECLPSQQQLKSPEQESAGGEEEEEDEKDKINSENPTQEDAAPGDTNMHATANDQHYQQHHSQYPPTFTAASSSHPNTCMTHYPPPVAGAPPHHHHHHQHYGMMDSSMPQPQPQPQPFVMTTDLHQNEALMRYHAAAFASAAAGAAWARAQMATAAADFANGNGPPPPFMFVPPQQQQQQQQQSSPTSSWGGQVYPQQQQQQPVLLPPFGDGSGLFVNPYHHPPMGTFGVSPSPANMMASSPYHSPWDLPTPPHQHPPPHHGGFFPPNNNDESRPHAPVRNKPSRAKGNHHHGDFTTNKDSGDDNDNNIVAAAFSIQQEQHPRKRRPQQQHFASSSDQDTAASIPRRVVVAPQQQQQQRGKSRRRLRSDGDSSTSSGSGFFYHCQRNRRYSNNNNYNTTNNTVNNNIITNSSHRSTTRTYNQKKKARSHESLLGKTAVAALYEWCSRKSHIMMPCFVILTATQEKEQEEIIMVNNNNNNINDVVVVDHCRHHHRRQDDFECTVYLDEKAWGNGRGRSKGAARQEAARRALQTLCPGVLFDQATGFVVEVPTSSSKLGTTTAAVAAASAQSAVPITTTLQQKHDNCDSNNNNNNSNHNTSLEDLAPHLAKQLAIGSSRKKNSLTTVVTANQVNNKQLQTQTKRSLELHSGGGTTTPSDEDKHDVNAYYTSRCGAGVLSSLLNDLTHIDPRMPNPPALTYHLEPPLFSAALERKTDAEKSSRGTFTCTAQLKVRNDRPDAPSQLDRSEDGNNEADQEEEDDEEGSVSQNRESSKISKGDQESESADSFRILTAQGSGPSKREARHVACARLLALLFPECETMLEVKEAAEAFQATYSARSRKKKLTFGTDDGDDPDDDSQNERTNKFAIFAVSSDPPLPSTLRQYLHALLNQSSIDDWRSSDEEEEASVVGFARHIEGSSTPALRRHGRKMQLDAMVEKALEDLNERDEEGRSLPEELTEDDVGRTVLRRAEPGDMVWIRNLWAKCHQSGYLPVFKKDLSTSGTRSKSVDVESIEANVGLDGNMMERLWSPSSIVLLLCRAIAAYEDPPLGCAVLFVDFCLERGRLLRVTKLATESHLPQERFVECLQDFAKSMQCALELHLDCASSPSSESIFLTCADSKRVIESYIETGDGGRMDEKPVYSTSRTSNGGQSTLQSVQEEGSELSDSSTEKRPARPSTKPSKRSRFQ